MLGAGIMGSAMACNLAAAGLVMTAWNRFAVGHSPTAGLVTAAVFAGYQQLENHVLNPVVMSRTVNDNPLLAILFGTSIGDWPGGFFGGFVAALISISCAAAGQIVAKELWQATAPGGPLDGIAPPATGSGHPG